MTRQKSHTWMPLALAMLATAFPTTGQAASGRDAVAALVGNTIDSRPTNTKTELFAYFAKDGTTRSLQQERHRTGTWSIIDGSFCVTEDAAAPQNVSR